MKILLLVLVLLALGGCASSYTETRRDHRLIRAFCVSSIDASLCLDLKSDQTYVENFTDGDAIVRALEGVADEVKSEPRGEGRWEIRNNRVVLIPMRGARRVLEIRETNDKLYLVEFRSGKFFREYR